MVCVCIRLVCVCIRLTVMAHMVSVLMDSVSVFRIGDTATRKETKMADGFTYSLTTTGEMKINGRDIYMKTLW